MKNLIYNNIKYFMISVAKFGKKKKIVEWLAKIVKGTGLSYLTFIRK